jgi:hypothetical protein
MTHDVSNRMEAPREEQGAEGAVGRESGREAGGRLTGSAGEGGGTPPVIDMGATEGSDHE